MFDDWKQDAPEQDEDPTTPCSVCGPDEDAPPCCEACAYVAELAQVERSIVGLYAACRTALRLARVYREEEGPGRRRELACVEQVRAYRNEIAMARFGRVKEAA